MLMPEMPHWNRKPCENCNGSGKDPKKRTRACPECSGSGEGNICADCNKPIGIDDENLKCKCQDIPDYAI